MHTSAPITRQEVLIALLSSELPLVAKGVADRIWRTRGTNTVSLNTHHVKPTLEALVTDDLVHTQSGEQVRAEMHKRGASKNSTFYSLTSAGRAAAEDAADMTTARATATELAARITTQHRHRLLSAVATINGDVQLTLTPSQATDLLEAPHERTREQAVRELVETFFGGDWTQALLAVASAGQIAVAYLDKSWFRHYLKERDIELTAELWQTIADNLDGFDEFVGADGRDCDFARTVLDRGKDDDDAVNNILSISDSATTWGRQTRS